MPTILKTKVTNEPGESFEELRLPDFIETEHNDEDPRYSTRAGQDSSHRTLTLPPGLKEWDHRFDIFKGSYPNTTEIRGAIIYCQGAMEKNKIKPFASTTIPGIEATLHAQDSLCSIPSVIGLPVWMRTYQHDPTINRVNSIATWLHIIGDLDAKGFGFAAKTVLDSAVVMRKDGRELSPRHLEVLCFFCKHVFEEVLEEDVGNVGLSEDPYTQEIQKKTFRNLACRKGFLDFYKNYCLEKGAHDERWRNLPPPYSTDEFGSQATSPVDGIEQSIENSKSATEESTSRRTSGRITRSTQKALDGAESSSPVAREEARGSARKRRHSTEEELGGKRFGFAS